LAKHPPKAVVDESKRKDPWKQIKKKPGLKVLDVARRSPRER